MEKTLKRHKKKTLLSLGSVGTLVLIVMVLVYQSSISYAVKVNEHRVGIIRDQASVTEIVHKLQSELEAETGKKVQLKGQVTFERVLSTKNERSTLEDIETELKKYIELNIDAFKIMANEKTLVYLEERQEAENIIKKIKTAYGQTVPTDGKVETKSEGFTETVTIEKDQVPMSEVLSEEAAYTYLMTGSKSVKKYTVKPGDTASYIAIRYDLKQSELKAANPGIKLDRLKVGQELNITVSQPLLTYKVVERAEYDESLPYELKYEETPTLYKGDSEVKVKGMEGKRRVVTEVTKVNGQTLNENIIEENILKPATNQVVLKGTKERPKTLAYGAFVFPSRGTITSRFGSRWGRQHKGIDIASPVGTPIEAADGGKVIYSGWKNGYGKLVIIDHENGYQTYYGHCSVLEVKKGQRVYRGQVIAKVGTTGNVTGPHVHFEVRKNGTPLNPQNFIAK